MGENAEASGKRESASAPRSTDEEMGLPNEETPLLAQASKIETVKIAECGGKDVLQFSSAIFYADEGCIVKIDVVRLGTLKGKVATNYVTEDLTAVAGDQYIHKKGQIVFEDGEHLKTIAIQVLDDDRWSATHEFHVILSGAQNCCLSPYKRRARVKILNTQEFPGTEFAEEVKGGDLNRINEIDDWSLYFSFASLVFWNGDQQFNTALVLIFDQLAAAFLYLTLWVGVYMVDTLFVRGPATRQELLMPDRYQTAAILGAWFIIPNIAIFAWECIKACIDIRGETRTFLQRSLLRMSMDYSLSSRESVTNADVSVAIVASADQVAASYVALLSIFGICGRIFIIGLFICWHQYETLAIRLLFMIVLVLLFFTYMRVGLAVQVQKSVDQKLTLMETLVDESCRKFRLFYDYSKRALMSDMFSRVSKEYNDEKIPDTIIHLATQNATRVVTGCAIAYYIVERTPNVLNGSLSLGIFLATISIFATYLADAVNDLNNQLMVIVDAFVPLKEFTSYLNMPLELQSLQKQLNQRRQMTEGNLARLHMSDCDKIPIIVKDLSFAYDTDAPVFENVQIEIPQGHLVAVSGTHNSGKRTLMDLLAGVIMPTTGTVFFPVHLRVLHVAREPMFVHASMLHNLVLGVPDWESFDFQRAENILIALGMPDMVKTLEEEAQAEGEDKYSCRSFVEDEVKFRGSEEVPWEQRLTLSQKIKLHVARALIADPEVIIFQRTMQGLNEETSTQVFNVIRTHVNERGLFLPEASRSSRRPRTVFFSTELPNQAAQADCLLKTDPTNKSIIQTSQRSLLPRGVGCMPR